MKRILLLIVWQFALLAGGRLFADVVTLKDGRQISGLVESGNIQELHIKAGDQSQTIDIHLVESIQFGVSLPVPPAAPAPPEASTAQANSLILKDGTHVSGRWWSIDASDVHFLVKNQLQHYPRPDVLGVTFGSATLPQAVRSTAPSAAGAQPPASPTQPARAPTLARPSDSAPPAAPTRGLSQPEEIGAVYLWKGKVLLPLETIQAVERKKGSTQYWEMASARSRVRVTEAPSLVFILRLPSGVNAASYSLFPLVTVNGARRTQSQSGRQGGLMTWPVDIQINNESSLITYALTVRDLPTGEYCFSPAESNDGYCFGVDPSAPGQ